MVGVGVAGLSSCLGGHDRGLTAARLEFTHSPPFHASLAKVLSRSALLLPPPPFLPPQEMPGFSWEPQEEELKTVMTGFARNAVLVSAGVGR